MSGFKNFIMRGGLVELAVAFIMATAFAKVTESFVAWLTGLLPGGFQDVFEGAELGDLGHFLNQVIAFVILGAIVYFFVVVPYTKAKERFFPAEAAGPSEIELLTQIRDSLASNKA